MIYYVFPPFCLILPVLSFLKRQRVSNCTIVVPVADVKPVWWPVFCQFHVEHIVLGQKGEKDVLLFPSKKGFKVSKYGLSDELWAAKLCFNFSL